MLEVSLCLCKKLVSKSTSSEDRSVKLIMTVFSCVLCSIERAHSLSDAKEVINEKPKYMEGLKECLKNWISDRNVIGGSIFGCSVHNKKYSKGEGELKVG